MTGKPSICDKRNYSSSRSKSVSVQHQSSHTRLTSPSLQSFRSWEMHASSSHFKALVMKCKASRWALWRSSSGAAAILSNCLCTSAWTMASASSPDGKKRTLRYGADRTLANEEHSKRSVSSSGSAAAIAEQTTANDYTCALHIPQRADRSNIITMNPTFRGSCAGTSESLHPLCFCRYLCTYPTCE